MYLQTRLIFKMFTHPYFQNGWQPLLSNDLKQSDPTGML